MSQVADQSIHGKKNPENYDFSTAKLEYTFITIK